MNDFGFKYENTEGITQMLREKNNILPLDFYEIIHLLCRQEDQNFFVDILTFLKDKIINKNEKYLPLEYFL